jgi:hypothetical protein
MPPMLSRFLPLHPRYDLQRGLSFVLRPLLTVKCSVVLRVHIVEANKRAAILKERLGTRVLRYPPATRRLSILPRSRDASTTSRPSRKCEAVNSLISLISFPQNVGNGGAFLLRSWAIRATLQSPCGFDHLRGLSEKPPSL